MPPRHIKQSALAGMAGISKQAISKRCRKDLAPALVGDLVDLDHPLVKSFLADRGRSAPAPARAPTKVRKATPLAPADPTSEPTAPSVDAATPPAYRPDLAPDDPRRAFSVGSPEDLEFLGRLLEPLIRYFGTDEGCKNWMVSLREKENIRGKRLDNEETEGLSIPREFVSVHILSFLDETSKRLLSDMPQTLVRRLFAMAHSGATTQDGEREARDAVSSHLEAVQKKIAKTIRDAARRAAERRAGADRGASALAR